ncbi:acyl-CoA dehydrogenase family protein [Paracoccus litorisediminis]|nr:acyl-CoA dehydrogenase family protein [Paracoccus litorisediminis]
MYLSDNVTTAAGPITPAATREDSTEAEFRALLDMVQARRDEFDRLRHVPRDVIAQMKRAGIFRASTPARFGGDALAPHLFLPMVERIAQVDGSAGWVAAFGSANTYIAALPPETQAVIYAEGPDQVYAGGLYPLHPATRANGGWTVSGHWRFASGCMGADWIGVGMSIPGADGAATVAQMAVCPADQVEIVESWNVMGMQGTGSHDVKVVDKFFADDWICGRGAASTIDEPLYHYPALAYQAQVHAAVNIGLARAALDLTTQMSGGAKIMPNAARLADRAYFRTHLAQAEAQFRSARLFFYDSAERAWDFLLAGDPVPLDLTNQLRLSATHAAHASAKVVQDCYRIAGMAAAQRSHRLQHILRDAMVVTQHAALSEATLEQAGAVLAGLPAPAGYP